MAARLPRHAGSAGVILTSTIGSHGDSTMRTFLRHSGRVILTIRAALTVSCHFLPLIRCASSSTRFGVPQPERRRPPKRSSSSDPLHHSTTNRPSLPPTHPPGKRVVPLDSEPVFRPRITTNSAVDFTFSGANEHLTSNGKDISQLSRCVAPAGGGRHGDWMLSCVRARGP